VPVVAHFEIRHHLILIILTYTLQVNIPEHSFLERVDHQRDRKLNGSSRSMASTHPMLAGVTSTSTHPGPYIGGGGGGGVGQSPDIRGSLRQHLSAEASSLTSKVHTVILTGMFIYF